MATPGIAVPGSVVAIGSQASPAGPQGIQGPTGPTAVSADVNNKAGLGSDSLILVPGVAAGVAATTHAQTVSGDDPQLTNARTPSPHAATHLSAGSDAIALVTTAAAGLCVPPDNTTIQIVGGKLVAVGGGGGASSPVVLGKTSADTYFSSNGIWVPRYATHPDQGWAYNTFDDHFDGSSLNAKWTNVNTAGSASKQTVIGGSFVFLEVWAAATGTYFNTIWQTLPVGTAFDVRCHIRGMFGNGTIANSTATLALNLCRSQTAGVQISINLTATGATPFSSQTNFGIFYGASFGTVAMSAYLAGPIPEYLRIQYLATKVTNVYWSFDGTNWSLPTTITAAQSGFNTTAPTLVQLAASAGTSSFAQLNSDWIKLIYS